MRRETGDMVTIHFNIHSFFFKAFRFFCANKGGEIIKC